MYYVVVIKLDGSHINHSGLVQDDAEFMFNRFSNAKDCAYCHYAKIGDHPINVYCKGA